MREKSLFSGATYSPTTYYFQYFLFLLAWTYISHFKLTESWLDEAILPLVLYLFPLEHTHCTHYCNDLTALKSLWSSSVSFQFFWWSVLLNCMGGRSGRLPLESLSYGERTPYFKPLSRKISFTQGTIIWAFLPFQVTEPIVKSFSVLEKKIKNLWNCILCLKSYFYFILKIVLPQGMIFKQSEQSSRN